MAAHAGPNTIEDGLVFAYDMENTQKSWKGKPTTNYISNPTKEVIATSSEFAIFENITPIFDTYGEGYYSISADIKSAVPGGITVYTASSAVEYNIGYYGANCETYYKRFYFNNIYVTNTNPDVTYTNLSFYGGYGSGKKPSIKNVQIEKNSFCTPFVVGTRSNSESVLDLTGNNILTVNNLNYNSDNTFSFNNSSSVITMPNIPKLNPTEQLSIEAWVKFDGNSADFIFEKGNVNTQYSLFSHGSDIVFRTYHSGDSGFHTQSPSKSSVGISNGVPVHIVGSWDGTTKRIYINGELKHSVTKSGNLVTRTTGAAIGRFGGTSSGYYFGGDIYLVKVYERGLTANEVRNNFNAKRTRYGI